MGINSYTPVIYLGAILLLSACGFDRSDDSTGSDSTMSTALPQAITASRLPSTGTINAWVSINGGSRQAMTINGSNASFESEELKNGSYAVTITVEYIANSDPNNPITLAEATRTATISNGNDTPLSFVDIDYIPSYAIFDDDNDGVGNLFELLTDNANLGSIILSAGNLDQVFQPEQYSYDAGLGYLAENITVTASTENENATLTINGVSVNSGVPSELVSLNTGQNTVTIVVTSADASLMNTYTLDVTRQTLGDMAQSAYVKAFNTDPFDNFGVSVAISGDTIAVGAYPEDSNSTGINLGGEFDNSASASGAVYVYTRSGGFWSQQAYIKASNAEAGDFFGSSVALSGNTLAVGAPRESSNGSSQNDNSANDAGAVYVFTRDNGTWSQQAYIKASNADLGDFFGEHVALSDDTLAVTASEESSNGVGVNSGSEGDNSVFASGAAYVFTRNNGIWSQQAYIKASNPDVGDRFGTSIDLSGDTLAVGAQLESGDGLDQNNNSLLSSGAAYIFTRNNQIWAQQAYLKSPNLEFGDRFGSSVAISGDFMAAGATGEDSASTGVNGSQIDNSADDSGAVYLYKRFGASWILQSYIKASNTDALDNFGGSIALSEATLIVGAVGEYGNSTGINGLDNDFSNFAGATYVFTRDNLGFWAQRAYVKASNTGIADQFGTAVAISGDTMAVGAFSEDSNGRGIGSNQADNTADDAGAVYVFR